jgi:hypothetical protein
LIFSRQPLFIFDAFRRWLPLADDDIFDISSADTLSPMFSRFSFLYRMLAAYCHAADILLLILMPLAIRHAISRSASRHATPFYAAAACRHSAERAPIFCCITRDAMRRRHAAISRRRRRRHVYAVLRLPFFTPGCHARRDAAIAPARRAICRATPAAVSAAMPMAALPPLDACRDDAPRALRHAAPRRRQRRAALFAATPILLLLLLRRASFDYFHCCLHFRFLRRFLFFPPFRWLMLPMLFARCLRCWLIYAADTFRFTRAGEGAAPLARCAIGALHAAIDAIFISAHAAYACQRPRRAMPRRCRQRRAELPRDA